MENVCENCGGKMAVGQTMAVVPFDDGTTVPVLITAGYCADCENFWAEAEESQG